MKINPFKVTIDEDRIKRHTKRAAHGDVQGRAREKGDIVADALPRVPSMNTNTPVRIPKAAELIAEVIRRQIVTGILSEGVMLPSEAELMEQFDVSRPTLREAIRLLEAESLVRVQRGAKGGTRICLPNDEAAGRALGFLLQFKGATLAEVLQARTFIEPPLAGLLAERATPDDIAALQANIEKERATLSDFETFGRATADFHQLIAERAGNVALSVVLSMLDDIFLRHVVRFVGRARKDQLELNCRALENHSALVKRIAAHDARGAERIWRNHMTLLTEIIVAELGGPTVLDLY